MTLDVQVDGFGRLVLQRDGDSVVVSAFSAFPLSAPGEQIALVDEAGREVALLPSLAVLGEIVRERVSVDLKRREFMPTVQRIVAIHGTSDPTEWHVLTDRGESVFSVPNEDHLRPFGDRGVIISDAFGVRYRVVDAHALDARSRRLLSRYF